jgi:hypothetical protein
MTPSPSRPRTREDRPGTRTGSRKGSKKKPEAYNTSKPQHPGIFKILLPKDEMITLIEEARYEINVNDMIAQSTAVSLVSENKSFEEDSDTESAHSDHSGKSNELHFD